MEILFDPGQSAAVTVLTPAEPAGRFQAYVVGGGSKRLKIACDEPLPVGAAVKIEWLRYIVMGEVLKLGDDGIVIHIRHVLSTDDVQHITQRWT